jgi:hypothetical protein
VPIGENRARTIQPESSGRETIVLEAAVFDAFVFSRVAAILLLVADPPNPRDRPLQGDLEGSFDIWFDDGAVKHDTGVSTYAFADGSKATTGTSLLVSIGIELADGRQFSMIERKPGGVSAPGRTRLTCRATPAATLA